MACSSSCDKPYEDAALVGRWREEAQIACGTGADVPVAPSSRIGEIAFRADGSFSVTWMPFESYKDYWGTFEADNLAGRLSLFVQYGNYVPSELDTEGSYEVAPGGRLVLRDSWLGVPRASVGAVRQCGHVFSRY